MFDPLTRLRGFFRELKRRKVYRVAAVYAAVAFVLVEAADLVFPALNVPSWAYSLVVVLALFGFPVALVLAWAFEVTPEGVRRAPSAEPASGGPDPAGSRRGLPAVVGLGLLAAAGVGAWYLLGADDGGVSDRSIAVLPFEATGAEASVQFSEGLYDGLLNRLANVSDLRVTSRTSAARYGEGERTIPEIGRALGIGWIVEGGVRQAGDRIRVSARLVDAREDVEEWAEEYDRDLTTQDLFAIETDLVRRIARSLQAELSSRERERVERRPTDDLEAYRLYVEGRIHMDRRTEAGVWRAVDRFQEAIERDSAYARAWSGLADARHLLVTYGYGPADTLHPRALEAARRALELDPDLAEAHASLGLLSDEYLGDVPAALRALERAVELKPSYASAYQWLGTLEGALGRPEKALEHLERAAELDPRSPVIQLVLGWTYWWVEGPSERALAHVRRAIELEPDLAAAHVDEGLILADAGRSEEAVTAIRRGLDLTSEGSFAWSLSLGALGAVHAAAGDTVRAREALARLEEPGGAPFWEAMVHAALGEERAAFEALREVEWTTVLRWDLRVFPAFDPLRDDPRYDELIREIDVSWGLNPDGSLPRETGGRR